MTNPICKNPTVDKWTQEFMLVERYSESALERTRTCFYKIYKLMEIKAEIKEYVALILSYKKSNLFIEKCIKFVFKDNIDMITDIDILLREEKKRFNNIDKFINGDEWKEEIVDKFRLIFNKQSIGCSREPETAAKQRLTITVQFLKFTEEYILNHYKDIPKMISPIRWFLSTATQVKIEDLLNSYCVNMLHRSNKKTRSANPRHTSEARLTVALKTLEYLSEYISINLSLIKKLQILKNVPDSVREPVRNHYYQEEIDLLYSGAKRSRDKMMLCILEEVGLRAGALANLKVSDVFDKSTETIKDITVVVEKQAQNRQFLLGPKLKSYIKTYFEEEPKILEGEYLFPSCSNGYLSKTKHVHHSTLAARLKSIAASAGIAGYHIHLHSFRHTIVNKLMAAGNTLENVSKFIGHKHVTTTEQYYWTDSVQDIAKNMNIAWLNNNKQNIPSLKLSDVSSSGGTSLNNENILSLLMIVIKLLTPEQMTELQNLVPNLQDIINSMSDIYTSTVYGSEGDKSNLSDFEEEDCNDS